MEALQRYDHPLKRARFRQFFFQGTLLTRLMARSVPLLIRTSLLLFFYRPEHFRYQCRHRHWRRHDHCHLRLRITLPVQHVYVSLALGVAIPDPAP
ncbi:hypothetical protein H4582DRAFT_2001129 [Lactarius indigo]|nr:hypothetical protein H4582DRAFT_2005632 [Lactarius indigo]KAI9431881.1 hypothetical protein H4582DRAFT_2001129 [Lactarius indigo]